MQIRQGLEIDRGGKQESEALETEKGVGMGDWGCEGCNRDGNR